MKIIADWNRYPDTTPKKSGKYMVTAGYMALGTDSRLTLFNVEWSDRHKAWNVSDTDEIIEYPLEHVVAWAEMPDFVPYMESDEPGVTVKRCAS